MTPGEFMLREAYLLGLPVPEPMRKKILQMSNRSMGLHESLISMAPPQGPLVAIHWRAAQHLERHCSFLFPPHRWLIDAF